MVSVIIPCFNAEQFIADAITSALEQDWPDLEVIVVDDGSTDTSWHVIAGFGDRIGAHRVDHRGAPAARNHGLAIATGEFIQFLDADDILLSDAVRDRVSLLRKHGGEIHAVFGDREFVEHPSGKIRGCTSHIDWPEPDPIAHVVRHNIHTESPLHRRNRLYEVGGFDEALPCSQELDLHLRLLLSGARMAYLPQVVSRSRVHSGPDRIENAPWWGDDPDLHLRVVRHHHRLIADAGDHLLTPEVQHALSFKLWSRGMIASRNGALDVGRRYFREARRYTSHLQPEGSLGFRLIHGALGSSATAWALFQKQKITDRLRRS